MADLRTIALIFAVCMIADFLYRAYLGKNEVVDSSEPVPDEAHTEDFSSDPTTGESHSHHEHTYVDEVDMFDEVTDSETYHHKMEDQYETVKGHKAPGESNVKIINILYCVAWSYRSTYDSVQKYIESKNPHVIVTGSEYPAPPLNQMIASLLGYVQIAAVIFMLGGTFIFDKLGIQPPQIYHQLVEKKMMVMMVSFILGNMIKNQLLSTGAFEIYFDDEKVFSKLETNEPPSLELIDSLLVSYEMI